MDNEKVQPETIRHSKIRRGISRTLSTAKYESIVIHTEIEEDIAWSTLEERETKSRNWDTLLIDDFKKTHDTVLGELNLSHKSAYFKDTPEKDYKIDEYDLDSLDSIG